MRQINARSLLRSECNEWRLRSHNFCNELQIFWKINAMYNKCEKWVFQKSNSMLNSNYYYVYSMQYDLSISLLSSSFWSVTSKPISHWAFSQRHCLLFPLNNGVKYCVNYCAFWFYRIRGSVWISIRDSVIQIWISAVYLWRKLWCHKVIDSILDLNEFDFICRSTNQEEEEI
mgnify:CR=1 FL=1